MVSAGLNWYRRVSRRIIHKWTLNFLPKNSPPPVTYADYVKTGSEEHQRRWNQAFDSSKITDGQTQLLRSFTRQMNVLVTSGIWCGDCATQCPLLQRIALGNLEKIHLRILDRDQHKDLSDQLKINAGARIPVASLHGRGF